MNRFRFLRDYRWEPGHGIEPEGWTRGSVVEGSLHQDGLALIRLVRPIRNARWSGAMETYHIPVHVGVDVEDLGPAPRGRRRA